MAARSRWSLRKLQPINVYQSVNHSILRDVQQVVEVRRESELNAAADLLCEKVRATLDEEVGYQQLTRPHPIAVQWSRTGRPVQSDPQMAVDLGDGDVTRLSPIIALLQKEKPKRQLVVLGDPGSGKSVLALLLTQSLAHDLEPGEPVPVLLQLSSWRPQTDLRDWMARSIRALCPELTAEHGRGMAARLVRQHRIMPVLDSLDELPPSIHARAIEAIDQAIADGVPLVVTCRSTEYERAVTSSGQHLTRAAVVELQPLGPESVIAFLRESALVPDRWESVFERIAAEPDSPIGSALSSPLMVYLARTVYRPAEQDPRALLDFTTQEALESHLLEAFIPTVYAEPSRSRYRADQARRWLEFMARKAHERQMSYLSWQQLRSPFVLFLPSLICAGVLGWYSSHCFNTGIGMLVAMGGGLFFGLTGFILTHAIYPDEKHSNLKTALRRNAVVSVFAGAVTFCVVLLLLMGWLVIFVGVDLETTWRYNSVVSAGFACAVLLYSVWGTHKLSHLGYWLTRRSPWNLADFLDEAHRLGVLRAVGSVYQFRHRRLAEQLGGAAWQKEPEEPDEREDALPRSGWSTSLLKGFVLLASVFSALFLCLISFIRAGQSFVKYSSGDRPALEINSACNGLGTCADSRHFVWELPTQSSARTVFVLNTERSSAINFSWQASITSLSGDLMTQGCPRSSVEVTVTMGGERLSPIVLKSSSNAVPASAWRPLRPVSTSEPVEIILRRLDGQSCTLEVFWSQPDLSFDRHEHIRQRLS